MAGHIHADAMLQYARDAQEVDDPWKRWEWATDEDGSWLQCMDHPSWSTNRRYRRIPTPLCFVEDTPVFAGDALWSVSEEYQIVAHHMSVENRLVCADGYAWDTDALTWDKPEIVPPELETLYQWAYRTKNGTWAVSTYLARDEESWRDMSGFRGECAMIGFPMGLPI